MKRLLLIILFYLFSQFSSFANERDIRLNHLFNELKVLNISCIADLHAVIRSYIIGGFFKLSFFKLKRINKGRIEKKALVRKKNKVFSW